jgi:hypothetical protein
MRRTVKAFLWAAAAAALVAACATTTTKSPGHGEAKEAPGPTIQIGAGHFSKEAKAFHYWDKEPAIPPVCAKCHAADGLATFLRDGKNPAAPHVKGYGFACTNCHVDVATFALRDAPKVTFVSGATVDSGDRATNLCMQCHMGIESGGSVNKAIAGMDADTPNPKINFVHVHYKQAGATIYGAEAKIGYEYAGKTYAGRFAHAAGANTCTSCHDAHGGQVNWANCAACHKKTGIKSEADIEKIRMTAVDWDGDGTADGAAQEIAGLQKQLLAAIQAYSRTVGGVQIAFTPAAYPYWYADRNGNGTIDPDELRPDNKYPAYTPRLLMAVYNYTFSIRDPGAAYHNSRYTGQLLHDSLESLAQSQKVPVNMAGRSRPQ